jgi:hypothetical protein
MHLKAKYANLNFVSKGERQAHRNPSWGGLGSIHSTGKVKSPIGSLLSTVLGNNFQKLKNIQLSLGTPWYP